MILQLVDPLLPFVVGGKDLAGVFLNSCEDLQEVALDFSSRDEQPVCCFICKLCHHREDGGHNRWQSYICKLVR